MKRRLLLLLCTVLSGISIMAQETPDKNSDMWYKCTYEYSHTSLHQNQYEYIESKAKRIETAVNAFKLEMYLQSSHYAYLGAPATLVWDDEKNAYRDDDNTLILSADFNILTFLDEDTDVFVLTQCYASLFFEETHKAEQKEQEEYYLWNDSDDDGGDGISWIQYVLYVLLALLPAIALLAFLLWRDRLRPEPAKELILACAMGLLSVPIAIVIARLLGSIGLYTEDPSTWHECIRVSFFGAAIPEEFAKLLILWVLFKWRKHQNEFMDGIVYAACIGLTFAAIENILYVLSALQLQSLYEVPYALSTGISRALLSVPGHFGFAVIMGYFFSFYLFDKKRKGWFLMLAYFVPVLFHGLYDSFAFMQKLSTIWVTVISFMFYLTFFLMNNLSIKAIRTAIKLDDTADQNEQIQSSNSSEA